MNVVILLAAALIGLSLAVIIVTLFAGDSIDRWVQGGRDAKDREHL